MSSSDGDRRTVDEFQYLTQKSQQLFAGLRDLPLYGQKIWQPYFQKTFEVFTKLWKFQQQNRKVLEDKDKYGLKRWEIGEIASKIGQLYYHYYLRTSETSYLYEAYIFYDAIRNREYFRQPIDATDANPVLVVKNMRFYARFLVVAMLLEQRELVATLLSTLGNLVAEYTRLFSSPESAEWQIVLHELQTFLQADNALAVVDAQGRAVFPSRRLAPSTAAARNTAVVSDARPTLKLSEAILVGNCHNQLKFSELTLDIFRIIQVLERKVAGKSGAARARADEPPQFLNPHKCLLYRPNAPQLLVYLATAFQEMPDNGALLLYISADPGLPVDDPETGEPAGSSHRRGGIVLNARAPSAPTTDCPVVRHYFYPEDVTSFTRKPMFLIVDSANSTAFKYIPRVFDAPLVALMSPRKTAAGVSHATEAGSLFTLFMYCPLTALAVVLHHGKVQLVQYEYMHKLVDQAFLQVSERMASDVSVDAAYQRFLEDEYTRRFICRFLFCHAVFTMHRDFHADPDLLPQCMPLLPRHILASDEIRSLILKLADLLKAHDVFS